MSVPIAAHMVVTRGLYWLRSPSASQHRPLRSGAKCDFHAHTARPRREPDMASSVEAVAGRARSSRGWSILAGVLLVFVGIEALAAPYLAALVAALWIGWGLVFGGVAEMVSAYSSGENRLWKVLLGLLYLFAGIYILRHPGSGLLALALVLAWLFLVKGVISIFGALQLRPLPGWGWWLVDGVITLLLAFLIFSGWPQDSVRIIALLVGISLIISGANRLAWAFSHCRGSGRRAGGSPGRLRSTTRADRAAGRRASRSERIRRRARSSGTAARSA